MSINSLSAIEVLIFLACDNILRRNSSSQGKASYTFRHAGDC